MVLLIVLINLIWGYQFRRVNILQPANRPTHYPPQRVIRNVPHNHGTIQIISSPRINLPAHGAFPQTGVPIFLQASEYQRTVIPEVEGVEIPITYAEPIPIRDRYLNFWNLQNTIQITNNPDDDIPIIKLYEPVRSEPIKARKLRFKLF